MIQSSNLYLCCEGEENITNHIHDAIVQVLITRQHTSTLYHHVSAPGCISQGHTSPFPTQRDDGQCQGSTHKSQGKNFPVNIIFKFQNCNRTPKAIGSLTNFRYNSRFSVTRSITVLIHQTPQKQVFPLRTTSRFRLLKQLFPVSSSRFPKSQKALPPPLTICFFPN